MSMNLNPATPATPAPAAPATAPVTAPATALAPPSFGARQDPAVAMKLPAQGNMVAFVVEKTPIVIPGIEGRITKECGPFLHEDPEVHKALLGLLQRKSISQCTVPVEQVKMYRWGDKIEKPSGTAKSHMSMGKVVTIGA